jgi:hypothetical protein
VKRMKWCYFCGVDLTGKNRQKESRTCRWFCIEGPNSCWKRYQRVMAQMKPRARPREQVISFHKNKWLVETGERGRTFPHSRSRKR